MEWIKVRKQTNGKILLLSPTSSRAPLCLLANKLLEKNDPPTPKVTRGG